MARMLSPFSNWRYKIPVFFSISAIELLQFYDSLLIIDTFIKSIRYCLDVVFGIWQICCLGSSVYFLSNSTIPPFFILNSGIMLPRFRVRFLSRSLRHSYSLMLSIFCNYVAYLPCLPCARCLVNYRTVAETAISELIINPGIISWMERDRLTSSKTQ